MKYIVILSFILLSSCGSHISFNCDPPILIVKGVEKLNGDMYCYTIKTQCKYLYSLNNNVSEDFNIHTYEDIYKIGDTLTIQKLIK